MSDKDEKRAEPLGDIEAAVESGRRSVDLAARFGEMRTPNGGTIPIAIDSNGTVGVVHEALIANDRRAADPRRRKGTSTHHEIDSFVEHINRHKEPRTTIWADVNRTTLTAIYNPAAAGDDPASAGWGDHRATYACPNSPEWEAWTDRAGAWLTSEAFADFIDSHASDLITTGEGADISRPIDVISMARNVEIFSETTCIRKVDPVTGAHEIVSKVEHAQDRSTKIPRKLDVQLRVFEGGAMYRVEVRLRWKVPNGSPQFSFELYRAQEIVREAFAVVREEVGKLTERPVFAGEPEPPVTV